MSHICIGVSVDDAVIPVVVGIVSVTVFVVTVTVDAKDFELEVGNGEKLDVELVMIDGLLEVDEVLVEEELCEEEDFWLDEDDVVRFDDEDEDDEEVVRLLVLVGLLEDEVKCLDRVV